MFLSSGLRVIPGAGSVHGNDSARQHGSNAVIDTQNGLGSNFSSLELPCFLWIPEEEKAPG